MTIAVAWVRDVKGCDELVLVTDSRLSGDGRTFDACTKAIALPRNDCAIAFAGYSGHAYPMMQQLSNAIAAHGPLLRGSLEITALKSHALKIFNSMAELILSSEKLSSPVETFPEANFLFGGYCWKSKRFEIWTILFSQSEQKFVAHPPKTVRRIEHTGKCVLSASSSLSSRERIEGKIAIAGDQSEEFVERLTAMLERKADVSSLDFEPFEVVRDMLRDERHSETIGGAPQIVKVYQYMKSAPLGVFWPNRVSGQIHLQGRPLLDYERTERWALDPDKLTSEMVTPNP
ncbi:MAG: hypothetical protein ACSHW1_16625 [Yoonia sp.]|uniref:hypothetical protein n=1 Tax=Yoonia sp. TaxID=2212373 RepID=UPI003EF80FDE